MGALKGAPCQVANIEDEGGSYIITLAWEDSDGESHTASVTLKDGVEKVSELSDVTLTSLSDGDALYWDDTAQKWVNLAAGALSDATYSAIATIFS